MRREPQAALVLRKYDYSETSQILRILTHRSGVLGVLARGSRRDKSPFGGALDLFYAGRAEVIFRPRSSLHLLSSFSVSDSWPELRTELPRFYAACHLAEILLGFTREEEPCPALFELATTGTSLLAAAPVDGIHPLLLSIELHALRELGFAPALTACAVCGEPAPDRVARLSVARGGLLCPTCRPEDPSAGGAPPGALAAARNLARLPPERAGRIRLPRDHERRLRQYLTAFVEWRLERRLRTASFL